MLTTRMEQTPEDFQNGTMTELPILEDYCGRVAFALKILFPFDFLSYWKAKKYFAKNKPDLVHFHNIKFLGFGPLIAAKENNIPVVFSLYDNWMLCPNYNLVNKGKQVCQRFHGSRCITCVAPFKKPLVFFRKQVFDHFLKQIDFFLLLTNGEKNKLLQYGIKKSRLGILPLPLFEDTYNPDENAIEADSLMFVGRIDPDKGLHVLIEALPFVLQKHKNIKLKIIGEPLGDRKYINFVQDRIRVLGLGEYVQFLGKKDGEEIKDYLRKTHIVVVPEQWAIAWPIFMTEAMLWEKVIVASDIGDVSEFIKDGQTGYLADPQAPRHFAAKIIQALEDGRMLNRNARTAIMELCNGQRIFKILSGIYEKMLCRPSLLGGD